MDTDISTRNTNCQTKRFPSGISFEGNGLVICDMPRPIRKPVPIEPAEPAEIFVGQWLKYYGVTQVEAGEIGGCGQSYIANISAGRKKNVNAQILLRLANHLDIKVHDFFRRPPSPEIEAALADLSPEARASVIDRKRRRG